MCCKIYKLLAEDVFIYEDEASVARKKELSTALIAIALDEETANSLILKMEGQVQPSARFDLGFLLTCIRNGDQQEGWINIFTRDFKALHARLLVYRI